MENFEFGTDGIRAHSDSKVFSEANLLCIARALANWNFAKNRKSPSFIIAYDTRESCNRIKKHLYKGLIRSGCNITDIGILPTPAPLLFMQGNNNYDAAIVISASHNPFYDNGIKIFTPYGKPTALDEKQISECYKAVVTTTPQKSAKTIGTLKKWPNASSIYKNLLIKNFNKGFLAGKKIVVDCANGSASYIAPEIFETLGADVIPINCFPNGLNINEKCGSQHPEQLVMTIKQNNADLGFSFDGDADRIIAASSTGLIKDGDDILAILSTHPDFSTIKNIVGTIMNNAGLELFLKTNNKRLTRTHVGDKHVVRTMQKYNIELGGEPSGHIIIKQHLPSSDGIFVALKFAETLAITNNWQMNSFKKFSQKTVNIQIQKRLNLETSPCSDILALQRTYLKNGRIVVRYSGTEPLLRIMVETASKSETEKHLKELCIAFKKVFKNQSGEIICKSSGTRQKLL
ncbi:hypothetical protein KAU11_01570 [Candidatus Babeliales bacterium]|nr:hypothetical protein [Candidatus Babeliales bacterium]